MRWGEMAVPDRDQTAHEIYLAAVELPTPEARERYLADACGMDATLRQQVDDLLNGDAAAPDSVRETTVAASPDLPELPDGPLIGPYKLVEQIGEGGMGIVYMAAQEMPVRRKVALKVIKPGMDSRQVTARFEAERQALSLMDHPNIARVLDAGTTAQGRPYFVMELVKGVPITTYCVQHRLPRRDRLQLFIQVCQAVAHAHQKGIIHRDLKPTNILVAQLDGRPVVKVIDFGVAKAIGQPLTDRTLYTGFTQLVGTLAYMSPEQAAFSGSDLDTRSDVYSLGVLLYELLTGTTPFTNDTLREAGADAFRQMIREDDPPLPSQRVSTLASEKLTALSVIDQVPVNRIGKSLRGELDWIVMQAIDKDRNRRYDSASELAADVERYLNDEPVRACPPTFPYLLRKFGQRHRAALSTGILLVISLFVGTTVAIWQAIDATAARKLAEDRTVELQAALKERLINQRLADQARDDARANAEQARQLLYAADVRLAVEAWQHNDVRKMRELLSRHIPHEDEGDLRGFEWYFLWRHTGVDSRVVLQSDRPLHCVQLSPDGRTAAVAGADGHIRILSTSTFELLKTLDTDHGEVNGVDFSPDGTELASAGDDGMVAVWNLASGERRLAFRTYEEPAYNVLFADGLLVTCGRHPDIRLWNGQTGQPERELKQHTETVQSVVRSSRGLIAAASDDDSVSCWDLRRPKSLWRDSARSAATTAAFNMAGKLLAVGRDSGELSLLAPETGLLLVRQQLPDAVHSLAFSPGIAGTPVSWLAVGDRGGSIHLIPLNDVQATSGLTAATPEYSATRQLQGHDGRVYSVAFTSDARHLFSAGEDGALRVWNLDSEQSHRVLSSATEEFAIIDDRHVASIGAELLVHDFDAPGQPRSLPGLQGKGRRVLYDAANDRILFTDQSQRLMATSRDGRSRTVLRPRSEKEGLARFAVSPDGQRLAAVIEQGDARWLEFPGINESQRFPCGSVVHGLTFSPEGDRVVLDQVKDILVLDCPEARQTATWSGHRSTIWDIARSPDGRCIATASKDRHARIWEWPTGRELWSTVAHAIETECVAFSPDGKTLATSGADRMLRLWRWEQDMLVLAYPLADWPTDSLAFTPDGSRLIAHSRDRLWLYDASLAGQNRLRD